MPRHPEPEIIKEWRDWTSVRFKCCHVCDNYNKDGVCIVYNQEPPEEYANYESKDCEEWMPEIPF